MVEKGEVMKALVAYFSHVGQNWVGGGIVNLVKGNTEVVAEYIRDITGADMFKIESKNEYPSNYDECTHVAKEEKAKDVRPTLKKLPAGDLSEYDVIFVGGPVWWGTYPMAVFTFLERYDLAGKIIMSFVTHEGSHLGECVDDVKELLKNSDVKPGLALYGSNVADSRTMIEKWIKDCLG